MDLNDTTAWDDTELINTWDEALEEYKKYHSIHLSGKRLEDVLTKEEMAQVLAQRRALRKGIHERPLRRYEDKGDQDDGDQAGEVDDDDEKEMSMSPERDIPVEVELDMTQSIIQNEADAQHQTHTPMPTNDGTPSLSSQLQVPPIIGVQDENLKNLLMAWYYAGYHTGLYEGRQQATKELSKNAAKT